MFLLKTANLSKFLDYNINPVIEILALIAYANNKGSDEPELMRSLVRAFTARTQSRDVDEGLDLYSH